MSHAFEANGAIYDDFRTVAASTAIIGRTSDSGHTWVNPGHSASWEVIDDTGTPPVVDPTPDGRVAQSSELDFNRVGIEFGSADVDIETTLRVRDETSLTGGLSVRNSTLNGYAVAASETTVSVLKITDASSGDASTLQSWSGLTVAELSVLRCVTSGNDFDVYLDRTLLGTVTDSTYTGTNHGLYQRFGGENTSVKFYAFNMHPPARRGWVVGSVSFG